MATLVFTAMGTALGGPLGGALGSLVGNRLDRAIVGSSNREGPRLRELSVTTSSYGTAVPRHYGIMRSAGSIIWATDLVESSEKGKGGKGRPSTTSYSYSASLAVALASRPIERLGRIWADGNLLRGAEGDLKTGGTLRVYTGHGDQPPDPLIAADKKGGCPAFRDLAYCVFEGLQLAEFGNRIPALTFEIIADDGEVTLTSMLEPVRGDVEAERPLDGLTGFSNEGGSLSATLATIDQVYPIALDASGRKLAVGSAENVPVDTPLLPQPAVDADDDSFGASTGASRRRQPELQDIPEGLRYYDTGRDFQAGLQRPQGKARAGRQRIIEFPGALGADVARTLASAAAERAGWSRESLAWRTAELDPAIGPGSIVRVPGHAGNWRIQAWEWRERGVELELRRLPRRYARRIVADAGAALFAPDLVATPTILVAFELPADRPANDTHKVFAAASSASEGWKGAALYVEEAGNLVPVGTTGSRRSTLGTIATALPPSPSLILERSAAFEVELASDDFQLEPATEEELAGGANRALVGGEVLQFTAATRIARARWRLSGLLRGRGATERAAAYGHELGTVFVLLDEAFMPLEIAKLGGSVVSVAAIGLADPVPVSAPLLNAGISTQPLTPVHPRADLTTDGGLLQWTRRGRGAWTWENQIETPLVEPAERYLVGVGDCDQPSMFWEVDQPQLQITADQASLLAAYPGQPLWVRQVGMHGLSDPLLLTTPAGPA